MNVFDRWLSHVFELVETKYRQGNLMTNQEHPELEKLLNHALNTHASELRRYTKDTQEYHNARRMFIALHDYMDIHNDFIAKEYRDLYKTLF